MSVFYWLVVYIVAGVFIASISEVFPKHWKQKAKITATVIFIIGWPFVTVIAVALFVKDIKEGE